VIDTHYSPKKNHLLTALPDTEYQRIFPHLELVEMPLGEVLYESGEKLLYVYFPMDCIISLLYVMENGASAEIAVVGFEGVVGIALFMGGQTMPNRAVVQSAGYCYRIRQQLFMQEFNRHGALLHKLLNLHTSTHYSDVPNRSVQPAPFSRSTALPLAAAQPRPASVK